MYEKDYMNSGVNGIIKSGDDIFNFPGLVMTEDKEESMKINSDNGAKIIIAGSGMSNGGRIVHHEAKYLPDPRATLLLVGYQALGTLGRMLQEGHKKVFINNHTVNVKCEVQMIGGFSAHKDSDNLVKFVESSHETLKKVFVVLGEPKSAMHLSQKIHEYYGLDVKIPTLGESIEIDLRGKNKFKSFKKNNAAARSAASLSQNTKPHTVNQVQCLDLSKNLKMGSGAKGVNLQLVRLSSDSEIMQVVNLQNFLIEGGYMKGVATGYFGGQTLNAVKKYQRTNGIQATGFVGEKTRKIMGAKCVTGGDSISRNSEGKILACPTEKIINKMPVMCIKAPCPAIDNSYYVYNNERKEISDFDANYVKNNCSVKESVVY
jgi:hypothetical protein